jgi:5-oxopent-3-ene-1,2,5-tricarboxylate decarboxylase/2-hydroxyhepta-2,4-diene-1,7-dioate isomerase
MHIARFIANGRKVEGTFDGKEVLGPDGSRYEPTEIMWLPPVSPSKVIGLVLNYADHANELGLSSPSEDPILLLKPNNTLLGHLGNIIYPEGAKFMHYEAELVVVVGRRARHANAKEAGDCIRGYTIGNDVTLRDFITNTFRPPVRAKGFDTFCPIGPSLVTCEEMDEETASSLNIETRVNGEVRQRGNTSNMIHSIPKIIEFITSFMTLEPEDIILTGTPKGISRIVPGDEVEISIDHLGTLKNKVVAEKQT